MFNVLQEPPGRRLALEHYVPSVSPGVPAQLGFDDLGTPLLDATFVVVDLETTGTSPTKSAITEIGAVKVRGGEVLGEFATLVNPGVPIPPMITILTGITTSMCLQAPAIDEVLPSFFEFAHGSVIVAHNARFDMGFLRAAARDLDLRWAPRHVVDTLALARRVVTRDESPNHKLSSLARVFRSETDPNHRALTDARVTVDVLHGLLERLGSLGVTHVEDLHTAADPIPPSRRRKVHLAENLPTTPGVYTFHGPKDHILYVGTATNLRRRVRQYFTSAEKRKRIGEMVDLAARVQVIECPTVLEAHVRELRLIAEHSPAYNRRSKRPHRLPWLRLTNEPLPRLSIVRSVPVDAVGIGPFSSRSQAELAATAIQELGVRSCTTRLPATVAASANSCVLGELGRCSAPCINQHAGDSYLALIDDVVQAMTVDPQPIFNHHVQRMGRLADEERFEEAARVRDQLRALLTGMQRWQRLQPLYAAHQLTAAKWNPAHHHSGGWEVLISRYGKLAATGVCPPTMNPLNFIEALNANAAHVPRPTTQGGTTSAEETDLLASWLENPGVRLVELEGSRWSLPSSGAGAWLARLPHLTSRA